MKHERQIKLGQLTTATANTAPTMIGKKVSPVTPALNPCPLANTMGKASKRRYKHP